MKQQTHAYDHQTVTQVLRGLETSTDGLTAEVAKQRLHENGLNTLPESQQPQTFTSRTQHSSKSVFILLIVASALSFAIGFSLIGYVAILLAFLSIGYTILLDYKPPHSAAFHSLLPNMVQVRRDGISHKVHASSVVVGDVIELEEGVRIPADVRIVETNHLWIDASEISTNHDQYRAVVEPVTKTVAASHNLGFQGSLVVKGSGLGVVIATSQQTVLGHAAAASRAVVSVSQPVQMTLNHMGRRALQLIVVLVFATTMLAAFFNGTTTETTLVAIGLILAITPFAFPLLTLEVCGYALLRFERIGAGLRRFGAVDTLGSTQILLADAEHVFANNSFRPVSFYVAKDPYHLHLGSTPVIKSGDTTLRESDLASLKLLFVTSLFASNAPTREHAPSYHDNALRTFSEFGNLNAHDLDVMSPALQIFPYDSVREIQTIVKRYNHDGNNRLYGFSAGSAEALLDRATKIWLGGHERRLTTADKTFIKQKAEQAAYEGKQTIALAYRVFTDKTDPTTLHAEQAESSLVWLGIVVIEHGLRDEVSIALHEAHEDHIAVSVFATERTTSHMVSHLSEMHGSGGAIITVNPSEFDNTSDAKLAALVKRGSTIFTHLTSTQKSRLVRAAQVAGYNVTMTGSSLEDAPALIQAHTGIALESGRIGLASDIKLSDPGLGSLITLLERARVLTAKLRMAAFALLGATAAKGFVVLASAVLLFIFDVPVAIALIHLVLLGLVFELLPAIAVSLDRIESTDSKSHHLQIPSRVLSRTSAKEAIWTGLFVATFAVANYVYFFERNGAQAQLIPADTPLHWKAMTLVLATLTICHVANLYMVRSKKGIISRHQLHNPAFWITSGFVLFLLWISMYAPVFSDYLKTLPLTGADWLFVFAAVLLFILVSEFRRYDRQHHRAHIHSLHESIKRRH